jgi:hypothetical protein
VFFLYFTTAVNTANLNPLGLFSSIVLFQIFECPDVVNLNFCGHAGCPALFADPGQEPLFEF